MAQVQGGQRLTGVEERLAVQGDLRDIARGPPATTLHLPSLLRGAFQVEGFLLASEGPAFHPPEALLALGFPQGY